MYKLIALYKKPADPAAFEKHYAEVHRPLVEKVPGLARLVVNRASQKTRYEPVMQLIQHIRAYLS